MNRSLCSHRVSAPKIATNTGADQRHHGELAGERPRDGKCDDRRRHEDAGAPEDPAQPVGDEEGDQRPHLDQQFDALVHASSSPAMARAKASASKGCRSPICSPTPIACTGRFEFLGDGDENAAARGAVELGHDEAGDARDLGEDSACAKAFCPVVASSTRSTAWGADAIQLLDDPDDLVEFGHQIGLVLQPAGRVDEQDVGAVGGGLRHGVEGQARGIGPRRARRSWWRRCARPTRSAARWPRRERCRRRRT